MVYFSANVSTFHIADLVLGNLFCGRYKYKSLKYGLIKYPACISYTVTGKCVLFFILLLIFYLYQPVLVKNICTNLPVLTRPCNSGGSWKYDLSGLCYVSDITLS